MAFNGLLQGVMQGIQGGADAGVYAAKGLFDDQRKVDVYKEMADIESEKLKLIEKFRSDLGLERKGKELELERNETIARGNNPDFLKATANKDIADVAGDIKLKQTRSADSIASEGAGGSLKGAQKAQFELLSKSITAIDSAITKAQADNTWDPNSENAKTLLERRSKYASQAMAILNPTGAGGDGRKTAADFDTAGQPTGPASNSNSSVDKPSAAVETPKMDVSTRRLFTVQGKDKAIESLQSRIQEYENAKTANPDDNLDYSKQIGALKNQIKAVQGMK